MKTNNLIKKLPIISATVLIFCFFLPWAKMGVGVSTDDYSVNLFTTPLNLSYTGYDMLGLTSEAMQLSDLDNLVEDIMRQTGASNRDIMEIVGPLKMIPETPGWTALLYFVIFIPLLGVAMLVLNSLGKRNAFKMTTLITGGFSMLIFLVMLIGHMSGSSIDLREYVREISMGMADPRDIPDVTIQFMHLSIGFYLLFLASLGCIVSFFTSFKSDQ